MEPGLSQECLFLAPTAYRYTWESLTAEQKLQILLDAAIASTVGAPWVPNQQMLHWLRQNDLV